VTAPHDVPEPAEGRPPATDAGSDPVEVARQQVMAVLSDVDDVSGRPPAEQVPAYTAAHRTLQATLAGLDEH
jgi:hypothetical protein